jgi:hypothetical protein
MKFVLLLVIFSVATSLAVLGQDNTLPFEHTACADGVDLNGQTIALYHVINQYEQMDTLVEPLQAGYADASAYFNTHGGICGAAVEHVFSDRFQESTHLQYLYFLGRDPPPVLEALYATPYAEELRDQLAEDGIPALLTRGGSRLCTVTTDNHRLIFATNSVHRPDRFMRLHRHPS